jgi:hypothetical protein
MIFAQNAVQVPGGRAEGDVRAAVAGGERRATEGEWLGDGASGGSGRGVSESRVVPETAVLVPRIIYFILLYCVFLIRA